MLFDSHTHINNDTYTDESRAALIAEIEASGLIAYAMDVGYDWESSLRAVADARALPWCYAAVGVHPHDAEGMDASMLQGIEELALQEPKVRAIGEIGLDFHYDRSEREAQRYWFRQQLRLASRLRMPVVIHSRDADGETMDILKEEGMFAPARLAAFPPRKGPDGGEEPDARVLLHCFSGSLELGRQYVKLGATLSVAGPVTYRNNRRTAEVATSIPLCYLLVETDAPYLTPEPFRGRPNSSPLVAYTARRVAELKGLPFETVADATMENAKHFFDIL